MNHFNIDVYISQVSATVVASKLENVGWALAQESANVLPGPQPTRVEEHWRDSPEYHRLKTNSAVILEECIKLRPSVQTEVDSLRRTTSP